MKIYNGYLNHCIRAAKKEFYHNEFNKHKNDIRKTWDTLKEIINKKTFKSDLPSSFVHEGVEVIGLKNVADKFNEYFTEIGPKLAKSIDTANKAPFNHYLTTPCAASFNFVYTKPDDIEKIIRNLKPKSSAGCDNISTKLLKEIENVISRPLSIIINQSLCTGIFPDKLKIAKVIPLYKKDDDRSFGNYRPISLLSSISKIFERVAFNQLYEYFTSNGLLYESQYGFRKLHSTELAALEFTDRISQEMDAKKIPFSISLDLSKAFDTLDHKVLLTKLHYYGIRDIALNWFRSYLTKRTQYVDCNGVSSSIREIETGVPQGSILGPLLFIIYMNDIHTVSDNLNFILYADDTTLSSPMCSFTRGCNGNIELISTLINSELNKIADWLAVNKLSLNVQKTKFMIFHYRQRVLTENYIPCLMINDTLIERVTEFNFLGLTVNEYMNWNSHVKKIANKISRTLGVMNRLKRYLPISAMKLMYDSLILSHLQFGITNWGFEWDRISKLQKRALRIMTNSRYNAHTEPLFKQLYLLKVKDIFDVQCMKFWYKFVNKKLPNYFRDMFKYNHEVHDIGTRSHDQLHLYPTRTSGARNVLRHHIPELLNTFPKYLIDKIKTHSLYSISHRIKCYLVDLYSYDCSIIDCYICNNIWKWQVAEVETLVLRPTVIADRSLGSRNGNPVGGRRLLSGRWLLRFSKDTNGSITLRSISTSEWIMTLFAMASLIEFVPLLSLCILDPVRELTHYFRWLNARETYPQCTEAASLVSFALSHPFVICHKLNMTLYCASITTVHAFPFRVASMPAVRYDLSGGLPTCLWLFIYQDYSVICISKKLR